jgi:hypothetical protein
LDVVHDTRTRKQRGIAPEARTTRFAKDQLMAIERLEEEKEDTISTAPPIGIT